VHWGSSMVFLVELTLIAVVVWNWTRTERLARQN
jgi:hypothetical protein